MTGNSRRRCIHFVCWALAALALLWARPTKAERLRVVTFNAYAVPYVSADRAERLELAAKELAGLAPNLVALQEVWDVDDAKAAAQALAAIGLPHVRSFVSPLPVGWNGAGLIIAADRALEDVELVTFTAGKRGHTPWHVDWIAKKGAAIAAIATESGPVTFAATHFQASYRTGNYLPVRVAQAVELADALLRRPGSAIVVGDLNVEVGEETLNVLDARAALESAMPEQLDRLGLDRVLFRSTGASLRVVEARPVLNTEVTLADGTVTRLSDHDGLLVDFDVAESDGVRPRRAAGGIEGALALIRADSSATRIQAWVARAISVVALGIAFFSLRRQRDRRWRARAIALAAAMVAGYAVFYGWVYAPSHVSALEVALAIPR